MAFEAWLKLEVNVVGELNSFGIARFPWDITAFLLLLLLLSFSLSSLLLLSWLFAFKCKILLTYMHCCLRVMCSSLQAHAACYKQLPSECSFGCLRDILLPPFCLTVPRINVPQEMIYRFPRKPGTTCSFVSFAWISLSYFFGFQHYFSASESEMTVFSVFCDSILQVGSIVVQVGWFGLRIGDRLMLLYIYQFNLTNSVKMCTIICFFGVYLILYPDALKCVNAIGGNRVTWSLQ